jgi:amino acid adenylation domain-containing protein
MPVRLSSKIFQSLRLSPSWVRLERAELDQSIAARFEHIAALHPRRPAVKGQTTELNYDELNRSANRIAHTLLNRRQRAGGAVGLLIQDECQAIAAILGVLKAGEFYVPLDRAYPRERLRSIARDCEIRVLFTERKHLELAMEIAAAECTVVALEDVDPRVSAENTGLTIPPTAVAAIFYTSGTTGQPKGVIQDHRSVLHRVMQETNAIGVGACDRLALLSAPTYSASLRYLFTALLNGAALYPFRIMEQGIAQLGPWLSRERITVYHSVPSVFRRWTAALSGEEDFSDLRILELGGEAVTRCDVELYKKHFPTTCVLTNVLGCSEAGAIRRFFIDQSTQITGDVVPVGYPVDDKEILLLDESGREVSGNEVGEITVRTRFLSPGYWKQPDLTASVFLPDPQMPGERIYRTGDVGCLMPDGCLLHKGRKDSRAKIRGIRVEAEEVEAGLHSHPAVQEAAVVIHDESFDGHSLMAYVTVKPQAAVPSAAELRTFLAATLPEFMLPSAIIVLEALPRLANGKVDRLALPQADRRRLAQDTTFVAPRDALEFDLASMWVAILGVHPISVRDSFFDLGGDSLRAAALTARIEKTFNQRFPPTAILQWPTVEQLAARLRGDSTDQSRPSMIKLQSGHGRPSVFCFAVAGGFNKQELFQFAALAPLVRRDVPFYGMMARGTDGRSKPLESLEEMAAAYVAEIKTVHATGPYCLLGECLSAPVAYEVARQLRASGDNVALCLLDGWGAEPWLNRLLGRRLGIRVRHEIRYHIPPVLESLRSRRRRIRHHLREIKRLGGTGRIRYAIGRLWRGGLATGSELQAYAASYAHREVANGSSSASKNGSNGVSEDIRHMQRAFWAYDLAIRRYRRRTYDGRITLIASEEWCALDPTLGWRNDNVEIHRIPGKHATYVRNQAHLVADVLRSCLDRIDRQAGDTVPASDPTV